MSTNAVKFWKGSMSTYKSLADKYLDIIYFIIDEKRLFLGPIEISNNNDSDVDGIDIDVNVLEDIFTWKEATKSFLPDNKWEPDVKWDKDSKWTI